MHEKAINARLEDWQGPFFPPELEEAERAYGKNVRIMGDCLYWEMGIGFANFFMGIVKMPVTSDGYTWFRALRFKGYPDGEAIVLFPDTSRAGLTVGDKMDRAIAIYTKGNIDEPYLRELSNALKERFEAHAEKCEFADSPVHNQELEHKLPPGTFLV